MFFAFARTPEGSGFWLCTGLVFLGLAMRPECVLRVLVGPRSSVCLGVLLKILDKGIDMFWAMVQLDVCCLVSQLNIYSLKCIKIQF